MTNVQTESVTNAQASIKLLPSLCLINKNICPNKYKTNINNENINKILALVFLIGKVIKTREIGIIEK